ncbi:hypothetical protein TNCV_4021601 [Trichonephila clavipes]|nr:hypothetical protein TNCV_4021601 [Trichonephila clavipes]
MTIGEEDWSGRCGLTWLLTDVLEVECFTWERAGWLLSDWMLSGEDNHSYWLPKGFKSYKMESGEMLVHIAPEWTNIGDGWTHNGRIEWLVVHDGVVFYRWMHLVVGD